MFLSEWREFPSAPCLAGKETWWQLASRFCWNCARRLTCFRACVLPGRAKDLSAPRYVAWIRQQSPFHSQQELTVSNTTHSLRIRVHLTCYSVKATGTHEYLGFRTRQLSFTPKSVFICLVWYWGKGNISTNIINQLINVMDTQRSFSEWWPDFLYRSH